MDHPDGDSDLHNGGFIRRWTSEQICERNVRKDAHEQVHFNGARSNDTAGGQWESRSPQIITLNVIYQVVLLQEVFLRARGSKFDGAVPWNQPNLTKLNHLDGILNEVDDPLLPGTITCRPADPKVLFFVRIPKCASTSFVEQMKVWSKRGQFELFFHPSGAYDWDIGTIRKVSSQVNSKKSRRFVYARHFYYTDFRMYGVEDYSYLTIIRDPVSRVLSSYLYYHFSSKAHIQAILNPKHKNESLLECIEHQHEGCTHNWLTKYFCGHDRFCKLGNEQALRTAKENILRDFTAVGILEEMEKSMALFRTLLPGYFSVDNIDQLPQSNKNEKSLQLTSREEEAIRSANQADLELYKFVNAIFQKKTKACLEV